MNFEKKNDNSDKKVFNKWINSSLLEENTKPIISTKNEYSSMTYHMWLGIKNYAETSSSDGDKKKIINKSDNLKNNIKIYSLLFNKIFSLAKPKIHNMNFKLINFNLMNFNLINFNLINYNLINFKKYLIHDNNNLIYIK
jgi:hypothetical protein